jgi:hypothetical protein
MLDGFVVREMRHRLRKLNAWSVEREGAGRANFVSSYAREVLLV